MSDKQENTNEVIDPMTGEVYNLEDMDDTEIAKFYKYVDTALRDFEMMKDKIKAHINERLEENTKDFGMQDFDVNFRVVKEYGIPDKKLKKQHEKMEKEAKKFFDKYKTDIGIARVETRITYPLEMRFRK